MCVGGEGETTRQSSHMRPCQLMPTTYLYAAQSSTLSEPSETIPSLSLKNFKNKKQNKKKPLKYLDITNQHAPSGLSQRMQWSLPPLTTLLMNNTNNSTKNE